jgi:hypothetical protein
MPGLVRYLKSGDGERLTTALIGPAMAAAAMLVSLAITVILPPGRFPEIVHACRVTGLADAACRNGAITAGVASLLGFGAVLVALPFLWRVTRKADGLGIHPLLGNLAVLCGIALIVLHLAALHYAPAYSGRTTEIDQFSVYISLENLLWPLLVQLLLLERDRRLRAVIQAMLLSIVLLSPYRSVALAVIIFAFVLPLVNSAVFAAAGTTQARGSARRGWSVAAAVLVAGAVIIHGSIDSEQRALTATPTAVGAAPAQPGPGGPGETRGLGTVERLAQRLAYPLYQGAIVGHLSEVTRLPGVADEFARKFRLSSGPNLNEFVYRAIYPAQAIHAGETTSLYFGEGSAYFGHGVLWAVVAPFLIAGVWFLLSRVGIDASAILAIQMWRSSFSGIVTILPALLTQLLVIAALVLASRMLVRLDKQTTSLVRASGWALTTGIFVLLAVQLSMTIGEFQRRSLVRLEFSPPAQCDFLPEENLAIQHDVDQALAAQGLDVRSMVSLSRTHRLDLVLPDARRALALAEVPAAALASYMRCDGATPAPAILGATRSVQAFGLLALSFAIAVYLLVGGCALLRGLVRRTG